MQLRRDPPKWMLALRWLGVMFAVGAGAGYYLLVMRPAAAQPPPTEQPARLPPTPIQNAATPVILASVTPDAGVPVGLLGQTLRQGEPVPDFTLKTMNGADTVSASQLIGQPLLINFWASWCLPCRAESPALERAYRANRDRGLVILGINSPAQDKLAEARAFVEEFGLTYPMLWDDGDEVLNRFGVLGLPTSIFVNRDGRVQRIKIGGMDEQQLAEYLAEIMP